MAKILILSNIKPQDINSPSSSGGGGWISAAIKSVAKAENIDISVAFPSLGRIKVIGDVQDGVTYYTFFQPKIWGIFSSPSRRNSFVTRKHLKEIIEKVDPEILHIFGTEFSHSRMAIELFNKPERTVIHIQGLVSVIAKHCEIGFPFWIKRFIVPHSILRETIHGKAKVLKKIGDNEIVAIRSSRYVMGRTEWDEACTKQINPSVNYIHCGETLRSSFYEESSQWKYEECNKHSIYFSQSSSQVKGLHLVLPILPKLIKKYPDVHLYIGGNNPIGEANIRGLLRRSSLGWYFKHQIKKYKLDKYITFLGVQNEQQVVQNLKNAHVFLSASLIENSPNSVGEALVVGTPVVSSDVGGVKDFIKHGENGYIYPVDEPYMIPYYIGKIFDDTKLAERFSTAGRKIGREKYSGEDNGEIIISTYKKMIGNL